MELHCDNILRNYWSVELAAAAAILVFFNPTLGYIVSLFFSKMCSYYISPKNLFQVIYVWSNL